MHYTELNREAQLRALSDACSTLANDKDKYGKPVSNQNLTRAVSGKLHNILCFTVMKIAHIDRA